MPSSSAYKKLSKRIWNVGNSDSGRTSVYPRIHVHMLSSPTHPANETHNMHLNMARFLATTSTVIFFPDGLSSPAPSSLHEVLLGHARNLVHPVIIEPTLRRPASPSTSLLSQGSERIFSSNSLLYMPRNASIWCPERFFVASPLEWAECLWYMSLKYPQSLRSPILDKVYEAMLLHSASPSRSRAWHQGPAVHTASIQVCIPP